MLLQGALGVISWPDFPQVAELCVRVSFPARTWIFDGKAESCNVIRTSQLQLEVMLPMLSLEDVLFVDPAPPSHTQCIDLVLILLFRALVLCECHFWTFDLLLFLRDGWLEYSV